MASPEQQQAASQEKWWTINAPIDLVRRRELVKAGETARLADVDTYISYINEDMAEGYVVKSYIYQPDAYEMEDEPETNGTRVYLQHDDGELELLGVTDMGGAFYGHKIELLDDEPILVQYRELDGELTRLGISLNEPAKIISDKQSKNSFYVTRMFRKLRWLNND